MIACYRVGSTVWIFRRLSKSSKNRAPRTSRGTDRDVFNETGGYQNHRVSRTGSIYEPDDAEWDFLRVKYLKRSIRARRIVEKLANIAPRVSGEYFPSALLYRGTLLSDEIKGK